MNQEKTPSLLKSFLLVLTALVFVLLLAPLVFLFQVLFLLPTGGAMAIAPYFYGVAVSLDQLGNAFLRGNPDQTISGRLGLALEAHQFGRFEWRVKLCRFLDWAFGEKGHCFDSIDRGEVKK